MNTSFRSLVPFLPSFCSYQLNSNPLLPSSYPGRLASRNSILQWTASTKHFLYNKFALTTQKTQPLYCCEGVFIVPLHSNGSYSIIAYVFVSAGMCLPSRCLAMNVYSNLAIPAFGHHVTIFFTIYVFKIILPFLVLWYIKFKKRR
jgi:hypothetical protein